MRQALMDRMKSEGDEVPGRLCLAELLEPYVERAAGPAGAR